MGAAIYARVSTSKRRERYRKLMAGRDLPAELEMFTEALTLKLSTAQRLLNGGE